MSVQHLMQTPQVQNSQIHQGFTLSAEEEAKLTELCQYAFECARHNDVESLQTLLDAGLNVNLSNESGNTLLMLAAYNGNFEATELLLKRGALVDKKNDKNHTPLAGVCFKGYDNIAELLLQYGANPNGDGGMVLSPMNCACFFGRKNILRLLLQYSHKKPTFLQRLSFFFLRV